MPRRGRAHGRAGASGDAGASALELSIIAPSLLLMIFLFIQASLWFYGRSVALSAARDAVSTLRLSQTPAEYNSKAAQAASDTVTFAQHLGNGAITHVAVNPNGYDTPAAPGKVSVTVTGESISLIPGVTLTVRQTAYGQIERFGNQP